MAPNHPFPAGKERSSRDGGTGVVGKLLGLGILVILRPKAAAIASEEAKVRW